MLIHGLNRLTLLDYPGHTGATLFLGGCNFRCPFCQNGSLVLAPGLEPQIPEAEVLSFLKKRQGILEGVCISGGEPTLHADLPALVKKIKSLGYLVKLDTNGTNPSMIRMLHLEGLLDYVAMDIKSSPKGYAKSAGIAPPMDAIAESAAYLMDSGIDYEFRTTVVLELHRDEDFRRIGEWLAGAKAYYLQAYQDSAGVLQPGLHSCTRSQMERFRQILSEKIPLVEIRGMD